MKRILALGSCIVVLCLSYVSMSSGQRAPYRPPDVFRSGPLNDLLIREKSRDLLMGAPLDEMALEEEAEEVEYDLDAKALEMLHQDIEDENNE